MIFTTVKIIYCSHASSFTIFKPFIHFNFLFCSSLFLDLLEKIRILVVFSQNLQKSNKKTSFLLYRLNNDGTALRRKKLLENFLVNGVYFLHRSGLSLIWKVNIIFEELLRIWSEIRKWQFCVLNLSDFLGFYLLFLISFFHKLRFFDFSNFFVFSVFPQDLSKDRSTILRLVIFPMCDTYLFCVENRIL